MFRIVTVCLLCLSIFGCSKAVFYDHNNKTVELESYKGQWLLINYWAAWCSPCRKEVPELNQLDQQHNNIKVLGVNFDLPDQVELNKQIQDLAIAFSVLQQDPREYYQFSRPNVLPFTVLISPAGKPVKTLLGPQTAESIHQVISLYK
ncbi:TlpA family protein disulfide reductase [Endozoicomonas sp. SM1973]|uniref:TlpA family protein disulfide reductase n=1 Tax=Spartinivicinus marinus TaxID=2994442 RepID=A0A853I3R8_9GAMM|nr:TlpA disulfide reductase family protein [Spartinivicinus marinus]MCX4028715.1 TlpA disulfide reductase family protein [Spartinivicinus marinus]NYZ68023.1 TlpA family protein disulfide reductase [Spartinivicinus marinus]